MIRFWHVVLVVGFLGLMSLFYKGLWGDPRSIPTILIGTKAPNFSGPEVGTGKLISLGEFQGKVVMVNFWASWCLECRYEHENLLAIQERFKENPDFVMLGINYQDEEKEAIRYLDVRGSNFRHLRDLNGKISIDYGVYGVPETFVFNREGIIQFKYVGPIIGPTFSHVVEKIIQPLLDRQVSSIS